MRLSKLGRTVVAAGIVAAGVATGAGAAAAAPASVPASTPAITAADLASPITAADIADPSAVLPDEAPDLSVAQTANGAVNWYKSRSGSTAYEGYCERAARLSWNRTTHHASAIEHWRSADGARHTTGTPPRGAFVFWNISSYGHVGIADGTGGVWATSVNGHIGHVKQSYFGHYLGWKRGNSN